MARRLSRRAGPEHPVLFLDGDDIPEPVRPPVPRAAAALTPYLAVLAAADAVPLDELDARSAGRTVLVGGERRPPEASYAAEALLDDGTAVVPVVLGRAPSRALRAALATRYLLVTGVVREVDGVLAIEASEAADLRALSRDWSARR